MWIVLEGLDGAGKTTTAKVLQTRGWCYAHTGAPGEGGEFPALLRTWWANRANGRIAWDRGHLGELYCAPVRRGTVLTAAARTCFEALLLDRDAEIWWLDPPADRLDSEIPLDQRVSERLWLQAACRESRVPVRRFTTPQHAQEWALDMAIPAYPEPLDWAGAGTRKPVWWALGEQASAAALCSLPFTTRAGMDMLWPHLDPRRVRVSNVLEVGDDLASARKGRFDDHVLARLEVAWRGFKEPKVLALGGTAEAAVRAAGLPVTATLRHPQYVRRFYHAEVPRWSEDFRRIVG